MDALQTLHQLAAGHGASIEHSPLIALFGGAPLTSAVVDAAEACALGHPQVECPVIHHTGPGVYVREVFMPADTLAIGHAQRFEQYNIFLKGRVTIIRDDGSMQELVAPMCFTGAPGRKVGYVHEDVVWLNVYATTETDVEKLEAMFLDKSTPWCLHHEQLHAIDALRRQVDRDDFAAAIAEIGVPAELVREQSENPADQTAFPLGSYKVKVARSPIEGYGLFATADIGAGERIAPARIGGLRTPAGRYTNHAMAPNARMEMAGPGGDVHLVALAPIAGCHGGTDGEEITIDYRQSVAECFKHHEKEAPCQE